MVYDPKVHHRHSIRLAGYDYSQSGVYYVTICTRDRVCLFGGVADGETILNDFGKTVAVSWEWLGTRYDHVELDEWVVMPNHIHGIILIVDDDNGSQFDRRGGSRTAPTGQRKPIGRLIGAFKTVSTKRINERCHTPGAIVWQRNYYEHIIRDETELNRIREYIAANPARWCKDRENPCRNPERIASTVNATKSWKD